MIYLISEETDIVTDNVESWLLYDKVSYKRINDTNFYNLSLSFNTSFLDDASPVPARLHRVVIVHYTSLTTTILSIISFFSG